AMRLLESIISLKMAETGSWRLEIKETQWQNQPAVQVRKTQGNAAAPNQALITTFVLDSAHSFALLSHTVEGGYRQGWTLEESGTTPAGLSYPKRYRQDFQDKSSYHTE